jgi:PEP-CTERM motif
MRYAAVPLLAVTLGLACVPVSAGTITETYNFTLGGFVDIGAVPPVTPPVSQISGSVTVTFDPTMNYDNDTTNLVVNSYHGPALDSPLGFTYIGSGVDAGDFFLGGTENDSDFVSEGTNDFALAYSLKNPSAPTFLLCNGAGIVCGLETGSSAYIASGYTSSADPNSLWFAAVVNSNPTGGAPGVPEPSTWAMMLAGLAGLGFVGYRRTKQSRMSFSAA